jgi:hypothetical protein
MISFRFIKSVLIIDQKRLPQLSMSRSAELFKASPMIIFKSRRAGRK